MIQLKDINIKTLIDSNQGIHMSAYIIYDENKTVLKRRIEQSIQNASSQLQSVLSHKQLESFLLPLKTLVEDNLTIESLKGNIGIFRTQRSFKVLSIPIPIDETCIIADSFHIKPILRWLQSDKSYLLLGIADNNLTLYKGSMGRLYKVDTLEMDEYLIEKDLEVASDWITYLVGQNKSLDGLKLFIAGESVKAKKLITTIEYNSIHRMPIYLSFSDNDLKSIILEVRYIMEKETKESLEDSITEYYCAEGQSLGQDNIYKVSRAAVQGRIKKLIIADDINIFGKLCKKTGDLTLHFEKRDHEDDDILDDLAQTVLMNGGKIILADQHKLPSGSPALAILERNKWSKQDTISKSLSYEIRSVV